MLVYTASKKQFDQDVRLGQISNKVLELLRNKHVQTGGESEYRAWQSSLSFMREVLDDHEIPDDADIAIEYQIPRTSKRVDLIISGADKDGNNTILIIELKQWEKAEKVADEMLHSVKAFTGGQKRIVSHPSYQAYSYAAFIRGFSEAVEKENIAVIPCAYLHNYKEEFADVLNDTIYKVWYDEAPFFIKGQVLELRAFIKKHIAQRSPSGNLMEMIDNGCLRPSKSLQDCLVSLMKGNAEFMLLDDQAIVYDMCKKTMLQCLKDRKKRTIIIQGGPGTGKSVLAINLLKRFISEGLSASYCTKNSAPREAYLSLLGKSDLKKQANIRQLFRSPFALSNLEPDTYDCLIVDEAHRLVKKMYRDTNGENQVKECIRASLFTVFLIDEDQQITTKDIGSIDEIERWANALNSRVISTPETVLTSQFRCNGSDQYIQLLNNILQSGEYIDVDTANMKFDIRVFDDPHEWRSFLREKNAANNKARMVAGYCYDWNVKNRRGEYDICLENGFRAKWNLEDDKVFAINPMSFEEVGCIHTTQGLEFDYVGVLIGKDLRYDPAANKIIVDKTRISRDDHTSGIRTADEHTAERLIKNTYRILLTRGQKGCYIYCEDKALSHYIKTFLKPSV